MRRASVLIIEDEAIIAADIAHTVRAMGHAVIGIASTYDEAVAISRNESATNLVLADIQLRDGSSGLEAAYDICSSKGAAVIFVTAFPERLLTARRPTPTFLITKPFQPETLSAAITQCLEKSGFSGGHEREEGTHSDAPKPYDHLPAPLDFRAGNGKIRVQPSTDTEARRVFSSDDQEDLQLRSDACRKLATRIIKYLGERSHNVEGIYLSSLIEYRSNVPTKSKRGNMLLADAEMRSIKEYAARDRDFLPDQMRENLERLIELHIALRSFYPSVSRLYKDFRVGSIETSLAYEAIGQVRSIVSDASDIFDESVVSALDSVSPSDRLVHQATERSFNTPDPVGEVSANTAKSAMYVGTLNRLWKAFLAMGDVVKAASAWRAAYDQLSPHVATLLKLVRTMGVD